MDGYNDSQPSKKKMLLIPLLTLLLCMTAITGCAFAYSQSSVIIGDNPLPSDYVSIDYVNASGTSIDVPISVDGDNLIVYTTITNVENGADTLVAGTDGTQIVTMKFYVKVSSDTAKTYALNVTDNVADVDLLKDIFTPVAISPIENVAKDTPTLITATFKVKAISNLDAVITSVDITDLASLQTALSKIDEKVMTFTVTATPESA